MDTQCVFLRLLWGNNPFVGTEVCVAVWDVFLTFILFVVSEFGPAGPNLCIFIVRV